MENTVGLHLAQRLHQAGLKDVFNIPGDFSLVLLDQLLKVPELRLIGCCNELNAGYAADGYARENGFACAIVTFTVGGLSIINAIAGTYSDDLPVLIVSGRPNTADSPANHRLHHTIGEQDFDQVERCFAEVVAETFVIKHLEDAPGLIDQAITTCLERKKPVYLEIACNLAGQEIGKITPLQLPPPRRSSDPLALSAAITTIEQRITAAVKPVLIGGVKLRSCEASHQFMELANKLGCAYAVMPDAKGLVEESHPSFMGTFWGEVSSPFCSEIVQSSDCQIFAGPVFTDYTTTGWSTLVPETKLVHLGHDFVRIGETHFSNVFLADLLEGLASRVSEKPASLQAYQRLREQPAPVPTASAEAPLSLRELRRQIQALIESGTSLVVETGDSWFNGQKLHLPNDTHYHFQMQYGSIGWAVGATLGVALATQGRRRTIAMIGDGSFQLTAQEVSTMIRYETNPIIFLLNNRGYTIEVEIHDGPYNNIKNWDYAGLIDVFNAGEGNGLGLVARTAGELTEAVHKARHHDGVVLIECALDRDDCTSELLEWGSRVAAANGR